MESGRLATGPMATTPRSIVAPAPIKRKHLALRSPRGGFDTTPRAATERAATKVPAPPMQPREAGTQASASARGFRPLVRDGINPSKHRAPVPEDLYATLQQEVRPAALSPLPAAAQWRCPLRCAPRGHPVTPAFSVCRCRRSWRIQPTGVSWPRRTTSGLWSGRRCDTSLTPGRVGSVKMPLVFTEMLSLLKTFRRT